MTFFISSIVFGIIFLFFGTIYVLDTPTPKEHAASEENKKDDPVVGPQGKGETSSSGAGEKEHN